MIGRKGASILDSGWRALNHPYAPFLIVLGYCVGHLALRLIFWPNFDHDDAELYFFEQSWRWAYDLRHPPLLIWIARLTGSVFHHAPVILPLLKYGELMMAFTAYSAAAALISRDVRTTSLSLLTLMAVRTCFLFVHFSLSFSIFLIMTLSLAFWQLAKVLERGRWRDYLGLIAAVAAGFWTKYIFALPVFAFAMAMAATPALARRIYARKLSIALALTAALVAPIAYLLIVYHYSVVGLAQKIAVHSNPEKASHGPLQSAVFSLEEAFASIAYFAVPFLVLLPDICRNCRRWLADPYVRMLLVANAIIVAVMAIGAAVMHENGSPESWYAPILITLPVALMQGARLCGLKTWPLKTYAAVMVALYFAGFPQYVRVVRAGGLGTMSAYWPVGGFARDLAVRGFKRGDVYAADIVLLGNLRRFLPQSRFMMVDDPLGAGNPPAGQASQFLGVSRISLSEARALVAIQSRLPGATLQSGVLTAPDYSDHQHSTAVLYYVLVNLASGKRPDGF